jgi:hypothetical protein
MAKPTGATVIIWRDLAQEGYTYAEIARKFPEYTVNQIRHYCLGNTGKKLPGPIQASGRWKGHNVWLQGEKSPHAGITRGQALEVLEDWDEDRGRFKHSPGSDTGTEPPGSSYAPGARRLNSTPISAPGEPSSPLI